MRVHDAGNAVSLWVSARETDSWARRWPCSALRGKRVAATFDRNGLLDLKVNGRDWDGDAQEFNALVADFLARRLKPEHPCYFVAVGQFREGGAP